jgi:serine/threonine protein kinase
VAIKKFRESDKMKEIKKITMREVKILKMVNHKNIIHLKESFRRKERLHLVFEFGGKTILDVMKEEGGGIKVRKPSNESSHAE